MAVRETVSNFPPQYSGSSFFSPLVVMILIFVSISFLHTPVPNPIAYTVIAGVYTIVCALFITSTDSTIVSGKLHLVLFLLLSIVTFLSVVANASIGVAGQSVVLLAFTVLNIFILPRIISLHHFLFIASRYSAILVFIGFLPYIGLNIQSSVFDLSLWGGRLYIYPDLRPITSIFGNPNAFGFLTLVGALAALFEWQRFRSSSAIIFFGINFIGLVFTNYRSGWIAFFVAMSLFIVYSLGGRRLLALSIAGGISAFTLILLIMFGVIPGPTRLTEISLGNRRPLWVGGVQAIRDQYLLGHGLGNTGTVLNQYTAPGITSGVHSTFIRMFMALGVVGGTMYIVFYLSVVLNSAKQATNYRLATIPVFLTAFFFVQVFESHSFLGASLLSVPIALMMGYHITRNE